MTTNETTTTDAATEAKIERMKVATTILNQLGGGRGGHFIAMTGAKDLVALGNGIKFRLPARFANDGINLVEITLTAADLYVIKCYKLSRYFCDPILSRYEIFAADLSKVFTAMTGLDCHL